MNLSQKLPPPDVFSLARNSADSEALAAALPEADAVNKRACIAAAVTAQTLSDLLDIQAAFATLQRNGETALPSTGAAAAHWPRHERPALLEGLTAKARAKQQKRYLELNGDKIAAANSVNGNSAKKSRSSSAAAMPENFIDADLAAIEARLASDWAAGADARAAVLDKWYKRVAVVTGRADLGTDGGKGAQNKGADRSSGGASLSSALSGGAGGQKLSSQIAHVVEVEEDRMIQRTNMRRCSTRSLCVRPLAAREAGEDEEAYNQRSRLSLFDDNVFDDTDFFSTLIRELSAVAADSADYGGDGSLTASIIAQQAAHLASKVKTAQKRIHAGKARSIRYDPIPKLVNFMAPIVTPQWLAACASTASDSAVADAQEVLVDELLNGLFRQAARVEPSAAEAAEQRRADAEAAATAAFLDHEAEEDEDDDDDDDGEYDEEGQIDASDDEDGQSGTMGDDSDDEANDAEAVKIFSTLSKDKKKATASAAAATPAKKAVAAATPKAVKSAKGKGKEKKKDEFEDMYGDNDEEIYGDFEVMG